MHAHTEKQTLLLLAVPFVTHTWLRSCGTTPGSARRLDCNKAHLVSLGKNSMVTLISSQLFSHIFSSQHSFPSSLSSYFVFVCMLNNLTGGMDCVMRNIAPHLLFHFCVFSCLNPFVFLSLYLCLIDAMSLFEFVWFGCAAVNIISTHQFHLTLHFSPSSVPSLYFFISVVISICMLFLCIASSLPQFFP